jgi:PAS domain-containing protein
MPLKRDIKEITSKLDVLESKFNSALDAAEVGIWEWNLLTNELYFDERMIQLYEFAPGEWKSTYQCWKDKVHPDDIVLLESKIKDCIEHDVPYIYWFRIKSYTNPSGWKFLKGKGKVIRDDSNKAIAMTGVNIESDCPEEFFKFNSNSSK